MAEAPDDEDVIEWFFVEVRRRTWLMAYFVNVQRGARIICFIFNRFNLESVQPTLGEPTYAICCMASPSF